MEANFLAATDAKAVEETVGAWARSANTNRYYSMIEIMAEIYAVDFDTDEFWRVASRAGDALRAHGFKQVNYKNRRFWVKKDGARTAAHNARNEGPAL